MNVSTVVRAVRPHLGRLLVLVVVTALVAGARAEVSSQQYRARALLRVEQLAANDLLGAATPERIDPERYLANELEVLQSEPVHDAALDGGADEAALEDLRVSGIEDTDIVQVSVEAGDPDAAEATVAAVVDAYQAITTDAARASVERQVAELDAQLLVLSERLADSEARLGDPDLSPQEAAVLQTQRETDAGTYAQLAADRQRAQARVGLAAPGGEVVEPAGPAEEVPAPTPVAAAAAGALAALAGGVGVLVARDRLRNRITRRGEVEGLDLGLRVHGELPGTALVDDGSGVPAQARRPDEPLATAFRLLRRGVDVAWEPKPGTVVLVASPRRHDGRTTVVANLAAAYARAGTPALAVDGDLRRGGLSAVLDLPTASPGLSSVLVGTTEPWDAAGPTAVEGLRAVASGPVLGDPVDLLGTERAVSACRDAADGEVVIVDSPPVLEEPDARLLALGADAVLVVVRAGHTSARDLEHTVHELRDVTGAPIGVVLNDVTPP